MTAWILTTEYNSYDQFGEYFVAWWKDKPSLEELGEVLKGLNNNELLHVLQGGGREELESMWYNLVEIEEGTEL